MSNPTPIWGLDLAQHVCGWAYWAPGMARPRYGSWALPTNVGEEIERYFLALRKLMRQAAEDRPCTGGYVIIEAPLLLSDRDSRTRARINLGLANEASTTARELGAEPRDTEHSAMMSWWVGHGYPAGKDRALEVDGRTVKMAYGKWLSMMSARSRGFNPKTNDAADALGLITEWCGRWAIAVPWDTRKGSIEHLELFAAGKIVGGA